MVRWHVGPLPTTLLENLVLITCGLYLVLTALQRGPLPWLTRYEVPIALFLLAGLIEVFVAPDHRGALGIFRAYLVEPVAIFYVAIAVLDTSAAIELVLAVAAVGAGVFGIIELGTFLRALINGGLLPGHAAAAFDINPNGVALYLEPLIGVAIGFLLFGQGRHRWVAAASLVILLPAEVATLSRGGLLSLAALAFIAILTVRQVRLRIGLVIASIAAVIIVLLLPLTRFRLSHAMDPISGTFAGRERLWIATLRMLHDHPIFGAGLNAYQIVMAPYRLVDSNLGPEQYPHNLLLTSWTELGLLGMFAFFYILISLIVQPWRALSRAAGVYRPLLWGTGAAFSMMLVHGVVDSPFWKNDQSLEFWLLAALQVVALRAVGSARPKANQKSAP